MLNRFSFMTIAGSPFLLLTAALSAYGTTLNESLRLAELWSAELSANKQEVSTYNSQAESALQLPDPKLRFGIENVPVAGANAHRLTREGMTMQRVGIMQDYVSSAKREASSQTFRAEGHRAEANKDVIRTTLQQNTALAWFDLAYAEKNLAAIERTLDETRRQLRVQYAGVSGGSATSESVIDLRLALSELANQKESIRRDINIARARMKELTGQDINQATGTGPDIFRLPADETLLTEEIRQHPEIIRASREADVAQARTHQSATASIPDVGVEVYYARRAEGFDDMAGIMFTVDLPVLQSHRQDKEHAADVSRAYEANDRLSLLVRAHQATLETLISGYNTALAVYNRQINEIIPLKKSRVRLAEAGYRTGNVSLTDVLSARRAVLDSETDKNNAEKALASAWAAIRYLIPQGDRP